MVNKVLLESSTHAKPKYLFFRNFIKSNLPFIVEDSGLANWFNIIKQS